MATEYNRADIDSIKQHLDGLVASPEFVQADRLVQFLRYVVNEVIAGRGSDINQYSLATEIYNRDASFDPAVDSVVRVDASRLRTKLREYYDNKDSNYPVRFSLPKGNYDIKIDINSPGLSASSTNESEKNHSNNQKKSAQIDPGKFPIVVLPLDTLSDEKQDQELADGITAQIISDLSNSTSISVVSRRSAFAFKGKNMDARQIAQELDVSYILEGILRRASNQVRISVALIDALSGQQMWSETYQKELDDSFELQDEIAHSISSALGGALWVAATEGTHRTPAEHLNAAGLVHRAADFVLHYSRHMFDKSERLVQRALELAPELGHVYTLIAFLSAHRVINYWTDQPEQLRQEALAAADRALEQESNDSWLLCWTADALTWMGEIQRGVVLMEHAIQVEPDNLLNQFFMGNILVHAGRIDDGLKFIEDAFKRNPNNQYAAPSNIFLSFGYAQLGDYVKAEETAQKAVELMGNTPTFWMPYINALAVNEKPDDAQRGVTELLRISPGITLEHLEWVFQMGFGSKEGAESLVRGLRTLDWS
jgi:adenylate cyclase